MPGGPLDDPVVPPAEINGSSRDPDHSMDTLKRNLQAEGGDQDKTQKVGDPAVAEAPQVRAEAVEKAQQSRVRAAEKARQMVQANQGKMLAALAFVLLVLWLRLRRSRRASRTGNGVAAALDQQARNLADEAASTGGAQDEVQKIGVRAAAKAQARAQALEKAQQARAQAAEKAQQARLRALEKAQQARTQASEKARQLREQATEKAQASEKAQQVAQEAQRLVQSLGQRLPRR
jgi:colicin import membrane protein